MVVPNPRYFPFGLEMACKTRAIKSNAGQTLGLGAYAGSTGRQTGKIEPSPRDSA